MDRVECQQTPEWALLTVRVHSHGTGESAELLVERLDGDVLRLQPPSDPDLLPMGGFSADISHMPRLTFNCTTLKASS